MPTVDRTPLDQRRQAFSQARTARLQAQAELATRNATLSQLARTSPPNDLGLQAARDAVVAQQRSLASARATEKSALGDVTATLAGWLLEDPALDIARLESRVPIVLLPLRLETRFSPDGTQLLVRIYPDEISADAHEPDLSNDEIAAGKAYWKAAQAAGSEQLVEWQRLLVTYPSQRAAWIVRVTDPKLTTPPAAFNKPSGWSRAVEARLLPDRFVVVAERKVAGVTTTRRAVGAPVAEPLALSVGPDSLASDQSPIGPDGSFRLDDAVHWTVDFDRALSVGMAVRLQIERNDLELGFDRVIVIGVKTSLDASATAQQLGELLDAQHYSAGLAFVKQGAPTSNVAGTPAAYPPADDNKAHSFSIERSSTPLDAQQNSAGQNLTLALGLPPGILSHVEGAGAQELAPARAMNRVLFPATFSYFLDQIMSPLVPPAAVNQIGQHFASWVVPRGVSSAFRVGRVPYGVLPVTSLERWQERNGESAVHQRMVNVLQGGKKNWMASVPFAPHVGATPNDPDKDLLDVLAMDASARQVRVRRVIGEDAYANLLDLLDLPRTFWEAQHRLIGALVLDAAGIPVIDVNPRVLGMNYNADSKLYNGTLVELDDALSETTGLRFNYINWARTATIHQLGVEQLPGNFPPSVAHLLLYRLMRHTALTEYHWWTSRLIEAFPTVALSPTARIDPNWREPELVKIIPGTENDQTPFERFTNRVTLPRAGQIAISDFLEGDSEELRGLTGLAGFREALQSLESLPSAELQRLFTESLDVTSHRLDAWITSLANERLWQLRVSDDFQPSCFIGAYGFVENLKPERATTVTLPAGATLRTTPGGYVHAPSMAHAMTAAVMRNAYMTHLGDSDSPYVVDLSSGQVRMGRFLLDSVRNGQPLGAVLGYLIERALHEAHAESLIDPIRQVAPLVANKIEDSGQPVETVAARNVVDGLLLRTKWKTNTLFGAGGLDPGIAHRDSLEQQLAQLDRNFDAVADLILAETVHQVVLGNPMGSGAGLDALAQGSRPPDPAVGHGQTGGTTLTHRMAIVLGDAVPALGPGWPAAPPPRAVCEPRLDAWVGALLGDPRAVKCRVQYPDDASPPRTRTVTVTFGQLRLRPLDVLALAKAVAADPAASELDRRVLAAAFPSGTPAHAADNASFTIVYAADPTWNRSITRSVPELLDLANAIARAIGAMRSLMPIDVVLPENAAKGTSDATVQTAEAQGRVNQVFTLLSTTETELTAAISAVPVTVPPTPPTNLQAAAIRAAMAKAAQFGVSAAFPPFVAGNQEGGVAPLPLIDQAARVLAEMHARVAAFSGAAGDAEKQALAIFGRDFRLVIGFDFAGATGSELTQALAYGPTMLGGDAHVLDRWLTGATRVREPLGRWRMLRLLAEANGAPPASWTVAQLPHDPTASWVGLPAKPQEDRKSGKLSLVLHAPSGTVDFTQPSFGLFLDEWVETIPNAKEHTGIAFRHDDTAGEAPQTILVAVCPTGENTWVYDSLLAIVNETIDLMKIRAVDLEAIDPLLQLIPGIFLAANAGDTAIATAINQAFDPHLEAEAM